MAPSASLQSRIDAFESVKSNENCQPTLKPGLRLAPLTFPSRPKPVQHILDTDSTSPTADALISIPPIHPVLTPSRPSSPAALGRKSSLIDFSELASPTINSVSADRTGSTISSTSTSDSFMRPQLPPRITQLPPLPPRKPSITSLKIAPTSIPPPLPKRHASSPVSSSNFKPLSTQSLLDPLDSHTYPPASPKRGVSHGFQSRHIPSSSTSSFHSVSLSSDGGDIRDSLDGSYEAVCSTAATSPTCHMASTTTERKHDPQRTPRLPQRQWQKKAASPPSISLTTSPLPTATRRPPPPPPQRQSVNTVHHSPSFKATFDNRVFPPPQIRKRYDALFNRNLPQYPRKGRASGWRGLSVDLLTNGEKPEFGYESAKEEKLDGFMVKQIWSCSKLPRARLREIWNECDTGGSGSLDRDAFAKGMWQIDEALRRAHEQPLIRKPPSRPKPVPPPPPRKPNFLLR